METYHGFVRTPVDAIKLFEACRLGLLPRVQRRLSEKERQSIRSGSVFVWDEREAGMRRWTDGKSWSASRVSGSFLTYREMEGKRGGGFPTARRSNGRTPDGSRLSDEDPEGEPEGYRYKADGLMKQSFSITTSQGQHLHLISYYSRPHSGAPELPQPSTDQSLRHIVPQKGMYPESSLHETSPPVLTRTPMQPYTNHNTAPEQTGYPYPWTGGWGPNPQWPPSPNHTPPWTQGKLTPEMKPQPLQQPVQRPSQLPPPPPTSTPSSQPALYPKTLSIYETERRPPGPQGPPGPPGPNAISRPSYTLHGHDSSANPRSQLQTQATQAILIDPRLAATSARNPQGPLPAMSSPSRGLTPPRTHSTSPPRTNGTNGSESIPGSANKASLSALLLHPTPANSEPNSANPGSNSASSSPRAMTTTTSGPPAASAAFMGEDVRAIRSLDRKFCP
ncbi:Gti1/Pac2 family-domain-containing protein [Whalleya microplaca]|nr:Gti1/Pac2 family-domain-containing protein [Whalleya microplaca]